MDANELLERAGYEFMAGANGRPGLWVRRWPGRTRVTVIRVDRDGWTATDYPAESYPDDGVVIASAESGLALFDAMRDYRHRTAHPGCDAVRVEPNQLDDPRY